MMRVRVACFPWQGLTEPPQCGLAIQTVLFPVVNAAGPGMPRAGMALFAPRFFLIALGVGYVRGMHRVGGGGVSLWARTM